MAWLIAVVTALALFAGSAVGQRLIPPLLDELPLSAEAQQGARQALAASRDLNLVLRRLWHWPPQWPEATPRPQPAGEVPTDFPSGFPRSFEQSKRLLLRQVYHDVRVEDYCGCAFDERLRIAPAQCPLVTPLFEARRTRIEWEHVVPASDFGRQRPCWRDPPPGRSGRAHCAATDETFRLMEADPHNLIPVVGALNAIRSNHRFGMVGGGAVDPVVRGCGFRVAEDGRGRFIEPPDAIKGQIARTYFYMEARYGLRISRAQRQLFTAWDRAYPVGAAERERHRRIAAATGVVNPYVEGQGLAALGDIGR